MKNFLFIGVLLLSTGLFSQNIGGIKGKVIDKTMNNEPLLMANVQIKGQEAIAQTNFNGNFEITNLSPGMYTLIVSYLGYETVEIAVNIKENMVSEVIANLSTLQFNLEDVAGMDTVLSYDEDFSSSTEKVLRINF